MAAELVDITIDSKRGKGTRGRQNVTCIMRVFIVGRDYYGMNLEHGMKVPGKTGRDIKAQDSTYTKPWRDAHKGELRNFWCSVILSTGWAHK